LDIYTKIDAPVAKIEVEYEEIVVTWERGDWVIRAEKKKCVVT
jgi:hypothetical protein